MNLNYTLFGQSIAFLFFVLFCMKYIWPVITQAMTERQAKIADGLAAADRAEQDLELAQERSRKILREAKQEASGIVDLANKRGTQIVEEAKEKAQLEAERIKTAAQAEIAQETQRARETLRAQVATLAIVGAEKVLEASVDESTHKAMLDKLAANL